MIYDLRDQTAVGDGIKGGPKGGLLSGFVETGSGGVVDVKIKAGVGYGPVVKDSGLPDIFLRQGF